jgi:hypothetical protein
MASIPQFSSRVMYQLPALSVYSSTYAQRQMLKIGSTIYKEASCSIAPLRIPTTPRQYVLTKNKLKQTEKRGGIAG